MNSGSGFVEVVGNTLGDYTQSSVMISSGLTSGFSYTFRYRARNIYGWGDFSQLGSAIMSGVPSAVTNVIVSQDSASTKIVVTWSAPSSTGGNGILITQYNVVIQGSDSNFYSDSIQWSPTSSTTLTSRTWSFEMLTLLSSPFSLTQGSSINVKVSAQNSVGVGSYSSVNSGSVIVQNVPSQPSVPIKDIEGTYQSVVQASAMLNRYSFV